jgi:uncharacterized protein YndB with AHSA1/START domain
MPEILHEVFIKTTAGKLYEAVTTQKGLAGWWVSNVKAEPKVGSINAFTFGSNYTITFRVEELVPDKRVVWKAVDVPPEWKDTTISFDITPNDKGVTLLFSHVAFPLPFEKFAMYNYHWSQYMCSIKLLLERGKGAPQGSPEMTSFLY